VRVAVAPLAAGFFDRSVHEVARELIGCTVCHADTSGVIVETESYHADEPACHAFNGRTARNGALFGPPGRAYVYFSYGMHNLLNFVTDPEGEASAVLIRALEPKAGVDLMKERRSVSRLEQLCSGPGKLTEALAIGLELNGTSLESGPIRVYPRTDPWRDPEIVSSARVGISKATDLPWRFTAAGNPNVSRPRPRP
jgi:DNA-3-methyladenine glycosylase